MLEVLTQDHMEFISTMEPDVFVYILSSISEGLTGIGENALFTVTQCYKDASVCSGKGS